MSREGHGRDRLSLNYRSFMFGKLPPPACPGLCYKYIHQLEKQFLMPLVKRGSLSPCSLSALPTGGAGAEASKRDCSTCRTFSGHGNTGLDHGFGEWNKSLKNDGTTSVRQKSE